MRRTRLLTLSGALLCTFALATAPTAASVLPSAPEADDDALRIMVTNDDGYQAPGITILADRLTEAGHDVTIVAPLTNQSGTGTKMSTSDTIAVEHPEPDVWAVDGTPGDAVAFGLSAVYGEDQPDLVISGANFGINVAGIANHSGTVGGAIAALERGVPAFAVSTGDLAVPVHEPTVNAMGRTSDFVVELIDHLQDRSRSDALLPDGVGLNINHPIVGEDGTGLAEGAAVTFQDEQSILKPTYTDSGDGTWQVGVTVELRDPPRRSDTAAILADQVSMTPISADWNTGRSDFAQARFLLRGVQP
ncbi:5'/3'-nucleotidase SurE [Nocardiopsis sp. NPDC049922]|uniref:5'/3'-nucleotidase SurE n=1 Tax=Nocardiopsis sp. NPDC049922 TaxID=3155157 RepID=UPI0033ED7697